MSAPKIWSQFSSARKSDGIVLKFCIQEATADDHEELLKFMEQYYINSEVFNKTARIGENKDAIKEYLNLTKLTDSNVVTLVCYLDDVSITANPIAGISVVAIEEANDMKKLCEKEVKTREVKKVLDISSKVNDLTGGMDKLGIDKWYSIRRIRVHPDYTGLGIATGFLKVWQDMSKERCVPAVCGWMTAIGSQKAAQRNGWTTYYETTFEEVARHCGCEFIDAPPKFIAMIAFADK